MPDREKFSAQMEEQLKHIRERLDAAKGTAEIRGNTALEHYEEGLEKLEAKYDLARYKLTLLRKGSGSAWKDLRLGFENAYHDLKEALGKAKGKF